MSWIKIDLINYLVMVPEELHIGVPPISLISGISYCILDYHMFSALSIGSLYSRGSFYFLLLSLCRYLKRGVNENGRVANDVETEQIVFEDVAEGSPIQISSVVQNRGSIPLFWSQETSRLNMKPDITCEFQKYKSADRK